jgi:sulfite reductase (NADPH) flavoprotein alpha-component
MRTAAAVEVAVYYGTEYGFAREIAQEAVGALHASRAAGGPAFRATAIDLATQPRGDASWKHSAPDNASCPQAALFVVSTHGDGVPPPEARPFFDWLVKGDTGDVAVPPFTVCALGDTSYTHFCAAGRLLDAKLSQLAGAAPFVARAEVNKEDYPVVRAWIASSIESLSAMELPPRDKRHGAPPAHATETLPQGESKLQPLWAVLAERTSLCVVNDAEADKDTFRVCFDLCPGDARAALRYEPGDALGVWPRNAPAEVERFLAALGAVGQTPVTPPSWFGAPHVAHASTGGGVTLEEVLTSCYELREPKPSLLAWLVSNARPQSKAASSASGEVDWSDLAAVEAFAASRHVADVLVAAAPFLPSPIQLDQLPSMLRQLQPRLYSISSSPLESSGPAGDDAPRRVELTIAVVRYTDSHGIPRGGVCSTFLCSRLPLGSSAPVFFSRNPDFRLPRELSTPIVMVGPGTGLAPFRAFIAHRRALAAAADAGCGRAVLFFGSRSPDQDFLYSDTLQAWAADGSITLHTAFSRQKGQKKVYVQDVLVRPDVAADVAQLLTGEGAHFYVCGDANHMAGDVDVALRAVLATVLGDTQAADAFVESLSASGRYQRDVWFA